MNFFPFLLNITNYFVQYKNLKLQIK